MKSIVRLIILGVVLLSSCKSKLDGTIVEKELMVSDHDLLNIRREVYGLTGGNDKIYLGKGSQVDSNNYYMYFGSAGFYYRVEDDTLVICTTRKSHIPKNILLKSLVIKQVQLSNAEMMNMHDDYLKYGFETIEIPTGADL